MIIDPLAALMFFSTGAFCVFFFTRLMRLTQIVSFVVETAAFVLLFCENVFDRMEKTDYNLIEAEKKKRFIIESVFKTFPSYYHRLFKFKDWDSAIEWAEKINRKK